MTDETEIVVFNTNQQNISEPTPKAEETTYHGSFRQTFLTCTFTAFVGIGTGVIFNAPVTTMQRLSSTQ